MKDLQKALANSSHRHGDWRLPRVTPIRGMEDWKTRKVSLQVGLAAAQERAERLVQATSDALKGYVYSRDKDGFFEWWDIKPGSQLTRPRDASLAAQRFSAAVTGLREELGDPHSGLTPASFGKSSWDEVGGRELLEQAMRRLPNQQFETRSSGGLVKRIWNGLTERSVHSLVNPGGYAQEMMSMLLDGGLADGLGQTLVDYADGELNVHHLGIQTALHLAKDGYLDRVRPAMADADPHDQSKVNPLHSSTQRMLEAIDQVGLDDWLAERHLQAQSDRKQRQRNSGLAHAGVMALGGIGLWRLLGSQIAGCLATQAGREDLNTLYLDATGIGYELAFFQTVFGDNPRAEFENFGAPWNMHYKISDYVEKHGKIDNLIIANHGEPGKMLTDHIAYDSDSEIDSADVASLIPKDALADDALVLFHTCELARDGASGKGDRAGSEFLESVAYHWLIWGGRVAGSRKILFFFNTPTDSLLMYRAFDNILAPYYLLANLVAYGPQAGGTESVVEALSHGDTWDRLPHLPEQGRAAGDGQAR